MTANQQPVAWHKSSRCNDNGCVEVGPVAGGVLVRNSADAGGPVLTFGRTAWLDFVEAIKLEEFPAFR